jgi:DNA-binding IclR family transcriptional regulator
VVGIPIEGISAIAAPLHDATGRVMASLVIAGPSSRFNPENYAKATLEAASRLSAQLGGTRTQADS